MIFLLKHTKRDISVLLHNENILYNGMQGDDDI